MNYPKELVEKAKRIYPNNIKLHQMLDKGSPNVGSLLRPVHAPGIALNVILEAKSLEELQEMARVEQDKIDLYQEWHDFFYVQFDL